MHLTFKEFPQNLEITDVQACRWSLTGLPYIGGKRKKRKALLRVHPELRIRIDPSVFDIMTFDMFMCHPQCSVAQNIAIWGSDIDGGLVVSEEPIQLATQLVFVQRLRAGGFDVCHPSQIPEEGTAHLDGLAKQIRFATHETLLKLKEPYAFQTSPMVKIYYGGYRIAGRGTVRENRRLTISRGMALILSAKPRAIQLFT